MDRLGEKVCVVTGAGSGIGRASALGLAAAGARVVCADVAEDAGRAVVAEIEAGGRDAAFVRCDVSDEGSVEALYAEASARFGRIDVLVNNAGVLLPDDRSVIEIGLDVWRRVLDVNLTGVFLCCKHGIPRLLAGGGGSVVNMGSISGLVGSVPSQVAYTASKGGVIALTRDVAVEFARRGIRANAICPGPVETPLALQLYPSEAEWLKRRVHIPGGRLGAPREIADAVVFLASDESSWITGTSFVVDGGIVAAYTTPE